MALFHGMCLSKQKDRGFQIFYDTRELIAAEVTRDVPTIN
jgi:hypothetical protein